MLVERVSLGVFLNVCNIVPTLWRIFLIPAQLQVLCLGKSSIFTDAIRLAIDADLHRAEGRCLKVNANFCVSLAFTSQKTNRRLVCRQPGFDRSIGTQD
jgi:hypothetical protein